MRTGRPKQPLILPKRSVHDFNRWPTVHGAKRCWRGGHGWFWPAAMVWTIRRWQRNFGARWAWWASGAAGF